MRQIVFIAILLITSVRLNAQQLTQTIRGVVVDNASNSPVPFASVAVLNTTPMLGATTDIEGNFKILNVPVGRYDVQVSMIGYEPSIIREVNVASGKESFLTVSLVEKTRQLNEVVIKPNVNKEQPLNSMATVSARMLSVDEANRYAGGFDDPSRLASSFAGVASNTENNGIVVRGNNPKFLQWKMEGVEIPNPNHFADLATFGGGGLTALSSQLLTNSDFFTGAFPSEYGNALSGVFDMFLRNGNNEKHEHTFQLGLIGIDGASEGPFSKKHGSSYLFNYRYSTLGLIQPLLPDEAAGVTYQDLSFKLNFPTKKAGTFSLWGIGLLDRSGAKAEKDTTKWFYDVDRENQNIKQYMATTGITHKYFFGKNTFWKTNLAASVSGIDLTIDKLNDNMQPMPDNKIANQNWNFVLASLVNTKFSARHTNKTGIVLTGLKYDMFLQDAIIPNAPPQTLVDESGFSSLLSAYSSSSVKLSDVVTMNAGLNAQLFTLNSHSTIEPRLGFKWQFKSTQSLGLAYGMHSRLEQLNYYFTKDYANNNELYNKDLDFTKAHHIVLGYDLNINEHLHFKAEAYYQKLYDVPVIPDSSFSFLNLQSGWFLNHKFENTGEGQNFGLDLTLEKYLSRGYYYMFTGSLFSSSYKGGDGIWRSTRYNRIFLFNFLTGKEWQMGKDRQNVFGVNVRFSYQGGDHYSPVNTHQSILEEKVIYDEANAFAEKLPPSLVAHLTVSYKINKKKTTHEFALKILNATQQEDFNGHHYNYINNTVDENADVIFIPNLSYKIEF